MENDSFLLGIEIKAYVTKQTLEYMKNDIKNNGVTHAHLLQTGKDVKIVWIDEK